MDRAPGPCPPPRPPTGVTGTLDEAGRGPLVPVPGRPRPDAPRSTLSGLPADYDLALYGDIEAAFDQLITGADVTQLAGRVRRRRPGRARPRSRYVPDRGHRDPDLGRRRCRPRSSPRGSTPRGSTRPRIYAPRIYAPRIYAPRIYAPRIYAPDSYVPGPRRRPGLPRRLLGSAEPDAARRVGQHRHRRSETRLRRPPATPSGYFYVRVQGHDDRRSTPTRPFQLDRRRRRRLRLRRPRATSGDHAHARRPPRRRRRDGDRHRHQQARAAPSGTPRARRLPGLAGRAWPPTHRRRRRRRARTRARVRRPAGPGRPDTRTARTP